MSQNFKYILIGLSILILGIFIGVMSEPQVEPERARERPPAQEPQAERDKPPEKQPTPNPERPPANEPEPTPEDPPAEEQPPAEEPSPPEQPPAQEPQQDAEPQEDEEPPPATEEPPAEEEPDSEEVAKQEYLDQASPLVFDAADTMSQIQQVLNEYLDETLTEQEAAAEIRLLRGDLAGIRAEAQALTPPQELQGFEDHLVAGLDFYIQGSDALASGLEQNDPNQINQASSLFEQGNTEIELANAELEKNVSVLRVRPNSMQFVLGSINKTIKPRLFLTAIKLFFSR